MIDTNIFIIECSAIAQHRTALTRMCAQTRSESDFCYSSALSVDDGRQRSQWTKHCVHCAPDIAFIYLCALYMSAIDIYLAINT